MNITPLGLTNPNVNLKRMHQLYNVICQQRKLLIAYTCTNNENMYGLCKQTQNLNTNANNENILWYMQSKISAYVIDMQRKFTKKVCKHMTCFLISWLKYNGRFTPFVKTHHSVSASNKSNYGKLSSHSVVCECELADRQENSWLLVTYM